MKFYNFLFCILFVIAIASCGGGSSNSVSGIDGSTVSDVTSMTDSGTNSTNESDIDNTTDPGTDGTIESDIDNTTDSDIDGATESGTDGTGDSVTNDTTDSDTNGTTDSDAEITTDSDADTTNDSGTVTDISADAECTTRIMGQSQINAQLLESLVSLQNASAHSGVCLEALPLNAIIPSSDIPAAVMSGLIDFGLVSATTLATFNPGFQVFDLPFAFRDAENASSFQNSALGQDLLSSLLSTSIVAPAFINGGFRQMSTNSPVLNPNDVRDKKIRRSSLTAPADAFYDELGIFTSPLAFSELSVALITGVVDGAETTISAATTIFQDMRVVDTLDGITITNHFIDTYILIVNSAVWDSFDSTSKENFRSTALELNQKIAQEDEDKLNDLTSNGITVRRLTDSQRSVWVEASEPIILQFQDQIGPELVSIVFSTSN